LAAGRSRDIHAGGTSSGVDDWGSDRGRGLLVGRLKGRRGTGGGGGGGGWGFELGFSGVEGAALHIRSVVSAGEPRPAPFTPLKADTTGLIKTPTNK